MNALRLTLAVVCLLAASPALRGGETASDARDLARELMSPYCPGRTLAECPSPNARVLREEIVARLRTGEPVSSVRRDLIHRFGDDIRGVTTASGLGAIVWWTPALVVLTILVGVVAVVRRSTAHGASGIDDPAADVAPSSPELDARLAEDLADMD